MCMHSKMLTEKDCFYCIRMAQSGPAIVGTIEESHAVKPEMRSIRIGERSELQDLNDRVIPENHQE